MKNKKLIGLASLMLTLGATGCPNKTDPCEKHTWGDKVVLKEATCTEAGESERTCTVCGEKEEKKPIKALGHDWKDGAVAKEATCTEKGSKNQTCSRCNATQTADIPALGHNYVDDEEGLVPATCEAVGSKNQHCSRCNDPKTGVEIPALGHKYENYVTTVEATCEAPGKKVAQCENGCGKTDEQTINALGHKPVTDDTDEPEAGKAAVRVYHCENGCGQTFLGFKASEVTDASKARLTIGTDGGASFWGRPIGNSLALTEDGTSKNQQNNECVYCRDEQGDFFEYVFDLTAAQATTLGSCRLYCDAMPANYLEGDFWAYNGSSTDWTPGYYIDDEDEHIEKNEDGTTKMVKNHTVVERTDRNAGDEKDEEVPMGKRITNYRYVLYVDGKVKDFDPDTKVTVEPNTRKEYVLPYTFNLHEGENRISLRMAGGYRSTFYNFTFRPYVEPTAITVNESALEVREGKTVAITGASQEGVTYTSSNTNIATVDANGVVTGVKAGDATITVSKEGNFKDAKVAVKVLEKEGAITLNLLDAVISENGIERYDSSSSGTWYRNPKNGGTMTYNFQSEVAGKFDIKLGLRHNSGSLDLATNMGIKVNGADVTVAGTVQTQYDAVEYVVGQTDLKVGDNTMVISFLADSALYIKTLKFSPADEVVVPPQPVHEHTWVAAEDPAQGENDAIVKKYTCECGKVKYEIASKDGKFQLDGSSKWKDDASDPTKGDYFKLKTDGDSFHFTFALPKAFSGQIYQRGYMDSYDSNKNNKLFYQRDSVPNIAVTVNGATDPIAMTGAYPAVEGKTYEDVKFVDVFGDEKDGSNSTVKDVLIGNIELGTANTITYKRVKTVNLTVSHLVFIGTEVNA